MDASIEQLIKDTDLDTRLTVIESLVTKRLLNLLGGVAAVPDELSYIVTEVSAARFNRIGSEGLSSHTVEGETMQWSDDDFAPYLDDIQAWRDRQDSHEVGRIRFL